jgi:hypothetical protein
MGADPLHVGEDELEADGEREHDAGCGEPPGARQPLGKEQHDGEHDRRRHSGLDEPADGREDDRRPASLEDPVPARPPGRGDVEGHAHRPQDDRDEDAGDDPRVDGPEPEAAREPGAAYEEDGEHGDARQRGEHPLEVEEAIEADAGARGACAEDVLRVEPWWAEVVRHLRPPQEERGQQPDCDGTDGYGRGSGDARRGHLRHPR